jgi:hypothetical protein
MISTKLPRLSFMSCSPLGSCLVRGPVQHLARPAVVLDALARTAPALQPGHAARRRSPAPLALEPEEAALVVAQLSAPVEESVKGCGGYRSSYRSSYRSMAEASARTFFMAH